ncbi:MAG: hypothetical protein ACKVG9_07395, partial [Rhodospirillales bacterium]
VPKIFSGWPYPVKGTPVFLGSDISLPFFSPDEGIREHVQRTGEEKSFFKSIVTWTDLDWLTEISIR